MKTPEERIADVWRRWTESVYGPGEQDGINERFPMSTELARMFADAIREAVKSHDDLLRLPRVDCGHPCFYVGDTDANGFPSCPICDAVAVALKSATPTADRELGPGSGG